MTTPHRQRNRVGVLWLADLVLLLCTAAPASAAGSAKQDCASLAKLDLPGFHLKVTQARRVPAGPFDSPDHSIKLPDHCLFQAEIDPRTGVGGQHYGIGFELRLPTKWNGRFFFQGGGGMDGLVRPALGVMPNGASTAKIALVRGYAVASTDAGHEGQDGAFGADQQARIDYYYGAIEKVTEVARLLLPMYYGAALERSYFVGCSNGGRQALLAAQRFPLLFDGVVAGDPAFNLTNAAIAEVWDDRTFLRIAPKNQEGQSILSRAFSSADLKLLGDSILAKCDALDGLKDGLIDKPESCRYDPAVLACAGEKHEGCLAAEQVAALKSAFAGPKTSDGHALYSDWPWDTGVADPGWRAWKLGTSETAASNALNMTLGLEATKSIHLDTFHTTLDLNAYDFDTATHNSVNAAALENATSTAMSTFSGHGGRMLLFTGMSDPIFSGNDLIRYFKTLQADNGGETATTSWVRLFLIPGMTHCSGGPALDDFDPLSALESWVEQGNAPDQMPARGKTFPRRERPICAYPAYPHYAGSGSIDEARNFTCKRGEPQ